MKLGLGTVQFGSAYGISNQKGQVPFEETKKILEFAKSKKIFLLDTAPSYNASETVLGKIVMPDDKFMVVTKTSVFPNKTIIKRDASVLRNTFHESLRKLNQLSVYGLLFHHAEDLLKKNSGYLWDEICELKKEGLVRKIGVSVYTSEQIDRVLEKYSIDLIQVPINVFDQRLLRSGHLKKMKSLGIEIHARSIFLQGLLLMDFNTIPKYFDEIRGHFFCYHQVIHQHGYSLLEGALNFVINLPEINWIILGVNSLLNLQEICSSRLSLGIGFLNKFFLEKEKFLNPSRWEL